MVLVFLCTYLGWKWQETATRGTSATATLQAQKEHLEAEVTRLQADLSKAQTLPILILSDMAINQMKEKGLADPVEDLVSDLKTRSDLIPFQPVGGGEKRITPWLITGTWVVAIADDGHRAIKAFLSYEIKNGQIEWTLTAVETDLLLMEQKRN
jgi:hypothetical protein